MRHYIVTIIGWIVMISLSACRTSTYGTVACGEIYLTDGTQVTIGGNNRLKLPSRRKNLVVINDIYKAHPEKKTYHYSDIDSIKVWHPASPDEIWTRVTMPAYGWCMCYVENPYIHVLTYSSQGYGVYASGRATNFYKLRIIGKSKVRFLMVKPDMPVADIGGVSGYGSARWRKKICSFVADDQELCRLISQSRRKKFEILRLLSTYKMNQ